jgi:hypothetical protein
MPHNRDDFLRSHPQSQRHWNRQPGRQHTFSSAVNSTPPAAGAQPGKDNSVIDFSYLAQDLPSPDKSAFRNVWSAAEVASENEDGGLSAFGLFACILAPEMLSEDFHQESH